MKDIIIKGARIKKEIIFFLISFVLSVGINIYGIIKYNTNWLELITQLHVVAAVSIVLYLSILLLRGVYNLIKLAFLKKDS